MASISTPIQTVQIDARVIRAGRFFLKFIVPSLVSLALAIGAGYKVYLVDGVKRDMQFQELKSKVEHINATYVPDTVQTERRVTQDTKDAALEHRLSSIEADVHDIREYLLSGRYPAAPRPTAAHPRNSQGD